MQGESECEGDDDRVGITSWRLARLRWYAPVDGNRLGRSRPGTGDAGASSSCARRGRCRRGPGRRAARIGIEIVVDEIRRALLHAPLATGHIAAVAQSDRIRQRITALGADRGCRIKVAGHQRRRAKIQGGGADYAITDNGSSRRRRCAGV